MAASESARKLREVIEKAIEDHKITRSEYDLIIHTATEDGVIDSEEKVLLAQLQDMIENKTVRFSKD